MEERGQRFAKSAEDELPVAGEGLPEERRRDLEARNNFPRDKLSKITETAKGY